MKKVIFSAITFIAVISVMLVACHKSAPENPETSLQQKLNSSSELQSFVRAAQSMVNLVNVKSISNTDVKMATQISKKAQFSKADLDQMLDILKIDKVLYQQYLQQQVTAIKDFQKDNHLTNEQVKDLWIAALQNKKDISSPSASAACQVSAYAVFAIESAGCIAIASIPIVGEALVIPCTSAAIAHLTASLVQCNSTTPAAS